MFCHHYLVVHSCQRLVAARPWDWPFFDMAFKANCGKASLVIGGNGWLIQQEANIRITRTNRPSFSGIVNILLGICLRNRQRIGHETMFVFSGSQGFNPDFSLKKKHKKWTHCYFTRLKPRKKGHFLIFPPSIARSS